LSIVRTEVGIAHTNPTASAPARIASWTSSKEAMQQTLIFVLANEFIVASAWLMMHEVCNAQSSSHKLATQMIKLTPVAGIQTPPSYGSSRHPIHS